MTKRKVESPSRDERKTKSRKRPINYARLCEVCHLKYASFREPNERKPRWCATCATSTAVSAKPKCEICKKKRPSYAEPETTRPRWCANCAPENSVSLHPT